MRKIELVCKACGKTFLKDLSIYKQDLKKCHAGKFCSKECFYKSPERSPNLGKKREKSILWKGGRIYERGYKMVLSEDHPYAVKKGGGLGYVREHRLVMEEHLGRYLTPDECIHPINGNISDNRIENLQLMSNSEHNRLHINRYWKTKKRGRKCC